MFKIKLLILLLSSISVVSCINNKIKNDVPNFSIGYIDGEFDGLLLNNLLLTNLRSLDIYDKNSNFEIKANINHENTVYITKIDNTSEREKITSQLSIDIINNKAECNIFSEKFTISQFYIFAASDKFLSNQEAIKKIKKDNTDSLIKKLISHIYEINYNCYEPNNSN